MKIDLRNFLTFADDFFPILVPKKEKIEQYRETVDWLINTKIKLKNKQGSPVKSTLPETIHLSQKNKEKLMNFQIEIIKYNEDLSGIEESENYHRNVINNSHLHPRDVTKLPVLDPVSWPEEYEKLKLKAEKLSDEAGEIASKMTWSLHLYNLIRTIFFVAMIILLVLVFYWFGRFF